MSKKPVVLMILDGYGLNDNCDHNAVCEARTPIMDQLMSQCPFVKGYASGMAVGLPDGQMGNSEVGHLNMGAGRIVYQELTRITKSIQDGDFFENPAFLDDFSGKENLEMIMSINKVIDENRLMGCLNEVGLTQSKDLKYKKYSLGMKQRLGIAAAFMEKPKLILLDEPTNALDEEGIQMLEKLINEMRDNNRIIIIASHEKDFLNKIADIVYLMDKGSICLEDN